MTTGDNVVDERIEKIRREAEEYHKMMIKDSPRPGPNEFAMWVLQIFAEGRQFEMERFDEAFKVFDRIKPELDMMKHNTCYLKNIIEHYEKDIKREQ